MAKKDFFEEDKALAKEKWEEFEKYQNREDQKLKEDAVRDKEEAEHDLESIESRVSDFGKDVETNAEKGAADLKTDFDQLKEKM